MLPQSKKWMITGILVAVLPLAACSHNESHVAHAEHPSHVEAIAGSDMPKVTFTAKAMERTDVQTASVTTNSARGRTVVPYSSIIYDPQGNTWVYTSPEPRTFIRHHILVDRIEGNNVYLREGPPAGTKVASQGVAEIYGTEFEVGH